MSTDEMALKIGRQLRLGEGPTALLDIGLDGAGGGWATISMPLILATLNGYGNAHGGAVFFLADTAFAYACNSRNAATVAQAGSITFPSPGVAGERISAHATGSGLSGRTGVYDVTLAGEDGRTVAIFQGISRALGRPALPDHQGDI
jgi:acyl-CoA thioesterase